MVLITGNVRDIVFLTTLKKPLIVSSRLATLVRSDSLSISLEDTTSSFIYRALKWAS